MIPCNSSFRDISGQVFIAENKIVRSIHKVYAEHWTKAIDSGFFDKVTKKGLLLEFSETQALENSWKSITSPLLPVISYPYEWCFEQYKDAALLTLDMLDTSLEYGLILKDATAYNIQFIGSKPIFIDHLSFEIYKDGSPWQAYLQFCRHFLAPLALMSKRSIYCGRMLFAWVDGLPLDLVATLLPFFTRFYPSLGIHIHMHAKMQQKYSDARTATRKVQNINLSIEKIKKLSLSLRMAIETLTLPKALQTEWGEYYTDTNYSENAAFDKKTYLEKIAVQYSRHGLAIDMGANEGVYSRFLTKYYSHVLAADIDYLAIEKMYKSLKVENNIKVNPLVLDLNNPSPGIGFGNDERSPFAARFQGVYVSALALIHHLVFTAGIPLYKIANYFAQLVEKEGVFVLEFVPTEDSQVQRLLAARSLENILPYSLDLCLDAFQKDFTLLERHDVTESLRTLLVFQKKR